MNPTRVLMTASALVLGALGVALTFAPDAAVRWLGGAPTPGVVLLGQIAGALYVGFAAFDWMTRRNLLGGIYGRPALVANLVHFLSAGIALAKGAVRNPEIAVLWPLAAVYAVLAAGFGVVLFRHPLDPQRGASAHE